jgi:HD-GYP domain-containing protein (c-di-GMP phosphodiesterase class II)
VGCHADSYEQARWFGDDIAARRNVQRADLTGIDKARFVMAHVGAGDRPARRARTALEFLVLGRSAMESMRGTHCLIAGELARRLGLGEAVREALLEVFERWDGKGDPGLLAGEAISRPVRLVQLADVVEVFHRQGGINAAVATARQRSGTQFDPAVVQCFCDGAGELLAPLADATSWGAVIEAQPGLQQTLSNTELDAALEAIADFADLKSPYTMGHSRAVADLAAEAGRICGLAGGELRALRRAGLVHDLGRLGVSNAIWDKRGALTAVERERVRLHPYLTERILSASPVLAPLGSLAAQHHERLDGSGYPRGIKASTLSPSGRILAAADVYQAMTEPRPHRDARSPAEAADELRAEARQGAPGWRCCGRRLAGRRPREQPTNQPAGWADGARGRDPEAARARTSEQGDRPTSRDHAQDRQQSRRAHLREDRRLQPRCRGPVRDRARSASRRSERGERSRVRMTAGS